MDKDNFSKIIRTYLSGRFAPDTETRLQKWLINDKDNHEKETASLGYWNELKTSSDRHTYQALKRVNSKIGLTGSAIPFRKTALRIAAVIIPLMIISGGILYSNWKHGEMVEVYVTYGEEKNIMLPDSTTVWINAGTHLKYPKQFDNQRLVHLDGEAYFSVTKDGSKPFIVQTKQLSVKVLGTQFNLKAYTGDERFITTLASGKIEVTTASYDKRILNPNEKLTYNTLTSQLNVEEVSPNETERWTDGQLIFSNSSFSEIIRTLERRFDLSISNQTNIPDSKLYTVKFLKNESIEEIISILQDIIGFTTVYNDNSILLK